MFTIILVCLFLASGCASASTGSLPAPPGVSVPPTTSLSRDLSGRSIDAVKGTTTTEGAALRPGNARIAGRVLSGGAPIAGATIKIERLVGGNSASIEVTAAADGGYEVGQLIGGLYRVRAYRPPDAAMTAAEVFFIGASENKTLDLSVDRFAGGTEVRSSIDPNPPIIGRSALVVVSLTSRGVDSAGIARSVPASGVPVSLIAAGGRTVTSPSPTATDGSGRARFNIVCNATTNQGLSAVLPDGSSFPVNVGPCSFAPPPTTTTIPGQPALPGLPPSTSTVVPL